MHLVGCILEYGYCIFILITLINFKTIGDGKKFKKLIVLNVIEDLPTSLFLEFLGVLYSKKEHAFQKLDLFRSSAERTRGTH